MPSMKDLLTNMSVAMPLHRKLCLVLRNNFSKVWKRQRCCNRYGEPGC